jgi:hypothetical protein
LSTSDEFWRKAEECIAKANSAANESEKAGWLDLAEAWVRLAVGDTSAPRTSSKIER